MMKEIKEVWGSQNSKNVSGSGWTYSMGYRILYRRGYRIGNGRGYPSDTPLYLYLFIVVLSFSFFGYFLSCRSAGIPVDITTRHPIRHWLGHL